MITNIISIIDELRAERAAGNEMAEQLIERIDAHVRDLETLKAWIRDSAKARAMAIGGMLGGEPDAPQILAAKNVTDGEAA